MAIRKSPLPLGFAMAASGHLAQAVVVEGAVRWSASVFCGLEWGCAQLPLEELGSCELTGRCPLRAGAPRVLALRSAAAAG